MNEDEQVYEEAEAAGNSQDEFPAPVRQIQDIETLKVIADPYRIRIIETMGSGRMTAKQLAARLDEGVHKLYYHIRLLEKHHIIVPVETNVVSGIVEKTYAVAARRFELKEGLLSAGEFGWEELVQVTRSILDTTLASLKRALDAGVVQVEDDKRTVINRGLAYLTDEQAKEFVTRLESLTDELSSRDYKPGDDKNPHALTVVFHRTTDEGDKT